MRHPTTRPSIVIASGVVHDLAVEEEHLGGIADLRLAKVDDPGSISIATRGAHALVINTHPMPRANLEALDDAVAVLGRAGTGLDAIDLEAARELGIIVYHTPDYCIEEVATHSVAWILALTRRLLPGDLIARTDFSDWRAVGRIRALSELRVGVIGAGRIGMMTARLLQPMVRSVVVQDPYAEPLAESIRLERSLDTVLRSSDVLTLHCPLTPETKGLIGERELGLMPDGAILVNCSRGGLVDESALLSALESGHLAGAALDVLTMEPPERTSPIVASRLVSLSPHIGWYSTASELRVRTQVVDGVLAILAGGDPVTGRIAVPQPSLRRASRPSRLAPSSQGS